jgi:hypothetical protein
MPQQRMSVHVGLVTLDAARGLLTMPDFSNPSPKATPLTL